jgi:hypothetical protein
MACQIGRLAGVLAAQLIVMIIVLKPFHWIARKISRKPKREYRYLPVPRPLPFPGVASPPSRVTIPHGAISACRRRGLPGVSPLRAARYGAVKGYSTPWFRSARTSAALRIERMGGGARWRRGSV